MKSGWVTKKLGEVCEIFDSRRVPITKKDRKNGPIPYYGATGQVDSVAEYLFDERLLLLGEDGADWSAGANSAYVIEGKSWVNNHAHVLKPHADIIYDVWLLHYLNASDLNKWVSGTTVPKLNQKNMCEIPIPIPPLAEQKRIVAKIDAAFEKIDTLKANAERNLANAKELFQSALDEAMRPKRGWVEKRLGEVCENVSTRGHQIQQKEIVEFGKYPVVSQSEKFIEGYTDFSGTVEAIPVILFGDHTCCTKYIDFPFVVGADGTKLLKVNQGCAKYLYYVVLKIGMSLVDGKYRRHFKDLKKTEIHLPPIDEQQRLAKWLDSLSAKCESLQQNYTRQIEDCVEMRQAILREAFGGRL